MVSHERCSGRSPLSGGVGLHWLYLGDRERARQAALRCVLPIAAAFMMWAIIALPDPPLPFVTDVPVRWSWFSAGCDPFCLLVVAFLGYASWFREIVTAFLWRG